jgi:hypothetical protein
VLRHHKLVGLAQGAANGVHGCADRLSKAYSHILILRLVRMYANQSKDFLNLDVVIDYDFYIGDKLPLIRVLNLLKINLARESFHTGLECGQDVPLHLFLLLQVNFKDTREVVEFLDLL